MMSWYYSAVTSGRVPDSWCVSPPCRLPNGPIHSHGDFHGYSCWFRSGNGSLRKWEFWNFFCLLENFHFSSWKIIMTKIWVVTSIRNIFTSATDVGLVGGHVCQMSSKYSSCLAIYCKDNDYFFRCSPCTCSQHRPQCQWPAPRWTSTQPCSDPAGQPLTLLMKHMFVQLFRSFV